MPRTVTVPAVIETPVALCLARPKLTHRRLTAWAPPRALEAVRAIDARGVAHAVKRVNPNRAGSINQGRQRARQNQDRKKECPEATDPRGAKDSIASGAIGRLNMKTGCSASLRKQAPASTTSDCALSIHAAGGNHVRQRGRCFGSLMLFAENC